MADGTAWVIPFAAAILIVVAVIYALIQNWLRRRRAERELLGLCQGDAAMLERLIAFEQRKTPGQTRAEAARAASYAIRQDNN
jgi:hypothetical protein